MGASWSAAAFHINAGMESGPVALKDFIQSLQKFMDSFPVNCNIRYF